MNIEYLVESPWTVRKPSKVEGFDKEGKPILEKKKEYPLTRIVIEDAGKPVVTKTCKMGFGVLAKVYHHKGGYSEGHAVCVPGDKFNFSFGARMALKRALAQRAFTKELRASIWAGFNELIGND